MIVDFDKDCQINRRSLEPKSLHLLRAASEGAMSTVRFCFCNVSREYSVPGRARVASLTLVHCIEYICSSPLPL